jgi:hypothetical protein
MNYYALKYGLNASGGQPELMQALKSAGADVIQTSDGLCIKTERSRAEVEDLVKGQGLTGISVSVLDAPKLRDADDTPPDVKTFMK